MAHQSDSSEHRAAEALMLAALAERYGPLEPKSLPLAGGARVAVDGVAPDESVFVEAFAHQGRMRGSQPKKVAQDALKLITLRREHPGARLVLAFADCLAAASVTGKGWLAEALVVWEIEVVVVNLESDVRTGLQAAQVRQRMVNTAIDIQPPTT